MTKTLSTIPAIASPLVAHGESPGEVLRRLRANRQLTLRDVAAATKLIATQLCNEEFSISLGRLSQVENKGVVPNIYRLYSLSLVFRVDLRELLFLFGIPRE